jgi:hypothetical protein
MIPGNRNVKWPRPTPGMYYSGTTRMRRCRGPERDLMAEPNIRVETVELDASGSRQIRARGRTTALLRDRADDIQAAVQEASAIVQESVSKVQDKDGWRMKSVEAKFGLVLTAEAGVVLSRASAEASFEVTLTIERG